MKPWTAKTSEAAALVDAALHGELSEAQALRLYRLGPEVVKLALLAASRRIAELQNPAIEHTSSPSTPSGMIPIYEKPAARKRRKKPGAKKGHAGHRRAAPTRIDRRQSHRLKRCPHCEGQLQRCRRTRTRIIEDIPRRHSAAGHRAHDSARLLPHVQEARRAGGAGRHAGCDARASGGRPDRMVSLWSRHHDRPDCGHSRLPLANPTERDADAKWTADGKCEQPVGRTLPWAGRGSGAWAWCGVSCCGRG